MSTTTPIRTLKGHFGYIQSMDLVSSTKLASASWDKSVKIWSLETGECLRTLAKHTDLVLAVRLLSNERLARLFFSRFFF